MQNEGYMDTFLEVGKLKELEYSSTERKLVFFFAFLGTLFDGADFFIFTYFLTNLSKYFGTSLVNITVIQATSYLAGIIGGIIFGMVADRKGRRTGLALTVAIYSIFTLLSAFAPNFTILLILRIFAGIGIGGESGIAFAYLNEVFHANKKRRGLFNGALQSMFIFGNLIAAWLFAFTSKQYGVEAWRWAFGFLGLVAILAAFIRIFMPESKLWLASQMNLAKLQKEKSIPMVEIFRGSLGRLTLLTTVMMTFAFFGAYGIITFGPTMWATIYKLTPATVAQIGYAGSILAIIAYVGGGWLSDIIGRKNSFTLTAAIGTVGYLLFLLVGPILNVPVTVATLWTSLPFICFVLMQLGYGYFGVQGVWLSELYPTHARTTGLNIVYYVGRAIGAGVAPLLALSIATSMGFDVRMAIAMAVIGTVGSVLLSRFPRETLGKELQAD
jgi:MFS family permease